MAKTLLRASLLSIFVCLQFVGRIWAQAPGPKTDVAFYIVAHQDDWQLFMGSHAYDDVQRAHTKVVFICMTAGQAYEAGDGYWRAREAGCRASVQKIADASTPPAAAPTLESAHYNGHTMAMMRYKNTTAYFLRLPDGNLQGQGFARCNYQSLKKLRNGEGSLTDLEGLNTYTSWGDLGRTVKQIVQQEISTGRVWMNAQDPDDKINPGDHSDHQMAGRLGIGAVANSETCLMLYSDYDIATRKVNLSQQQMAKQSTVFAVYCQGLTSNGQPTAWDPGHLRFMGRQYYRVRHTNGTNAPVRSVISRSNADLENLKEEEEPVSKSLVLEPNYPNPFDEASLLVYDLPADGFVTLRIYDLRGTVVKTLVEKEQAAGRHEVWLEVDQFPASGMYICQIQAAGQHREQRLQIKR